MRTKHQFRLSEQWALEDRIALSQVSAIVDRATPPAPTGLRATFTGRYLATPAGIPGGESQLNLNGSTRIPSLGNVRIAGNLAVNPSATPSATGTNGVLTLIARRAGGNVVTVVTGPTADLTSRTRTTAQLHYRVVAAPQSLAAFIGTEGMATMTLRPRQRNVPAAGPIPGQFTLRVVQG